ncbi:Uncharacterised protein [Chryseobacterium gleum]|uniref:Uncharacterized protein n=1 Tax=Chryseobacterium gleum TaxID=250 RepID=A0A3S4M3J1_CHRGE|nr:Uncharacterised protein [Chryseobacterium gleum]
MKKQMRIAPIIRISYTKKQMMIYNYTNNKR